LDNKVLDIIDARWNHEVNAHIIFLYEKQLKDLYLNTEVQLK